MISDCNFNCEDTSSHCTQCYTPTIPDDSCKRMKSELWNLTIWICHDNDVISVNRKGSWITRVTNYMPAAVRLDNLRFSCHHRQLCSSNRVPRNTTIPQKGHGFRQSKMRNGGRILLVVLNLYVPINIRVPIFDNDNSVIDITQSIATSIPSEVSSFCSQVSHHSSPQCRCVRRNDQFEVSRWFLTF